jgi:carbon-monoxide dehydrogenase small subunit
MAEAATRRIRLRVNGSEHELDVQPGRLLVDLLREDLGLTGTKESCGIGVCGACTVLVDGRMIASCIALAVSADGHELTTVEGLARDGRLHPVQQAFVEHGGLQCGFCTPGMVLAAAALLCEKPSPQDAEIRDWMTGNLCRCTGYYKIAESVRRAAAALAAPRAVPARESDEER